MQRLLILVALALASDDPAETTFKITTKKPDDRVVVNILNQKARVTIHSPSGISHAIVKRTDSTWPDSLIVQLHTSGLEHFSLSDGKTTLAGAVAIRDGKPSIQTTLRDSTENPLTPADPLWIEVGMFMDDGKPASQLPLKKGYFELSVPRAMLQDNRAEISLEWIDFYRN